MEKVDTDSATNLKPEFQGDKEDWAAVQEERWPIAARFRGCVHQPEHAQFVSANHMGVFLTVQTD